MAADRFSTVEEDIEIGEALGFARKSQTHRIIKQIEHRVVISRLPGRTRSIQLLGYHRHRVIVPVPADPDDEEFERAKVAALLAEKDGEDVFWAFWQAMVTPYQREDQ